MAEGFSHATAGTCPGGGCQLRGLCHCGCGGATALAPYNRDGSPRWGRCVRGEPRIWLPGHHRPWRNSSHLWGRQGVEAARIEPLVRWLVAVYGTQRRAAEALGVPKRWVTGVVHGEHPRCSPDRARLVAEVVLAHRRARPNLWDSEAECARLAVEAERRETQRAIWADQQRAARAKKAARHG